MKPIELKMTAFGPYSGNETINFSQIEDNSLFLITGPTGSGKTTIFDAICYALYGETSGNLRSGESLKSDYSKNELLSSVSFKFSLRKKEYFIERSPKQEKKKTRGIGYTTHNGDAYLKISDKDEPIVGITKVNEEIEKIIGLNSGQFRQIMMIPQGSFQELLNSGSANREEILRTLFDTSIYSRIQYSLKDKEISLKNEISEKTLIRRTHIGNISCEDDSELLNFKDDDHPQMDKLITALSESDKKDQLSIINKIELIKEIDFKIKELLTDKERAVRNNDKLNQFDLLKRKMDILNNDKILFSELKVKITNAHSAEKVLPIENTLRKYEDQKKSISERLSNSEKQLESQKIIHQQLDAKNIINESVESKKEIDDLKNEILDITRYNEKLKDYTSLKKNLSESEKSKKECEIKLKKIEADKILLSEKIYSLRNDQKKQNQITIELNELRNKIKDISNIGNILKEMISKKYEIDKLENSYIVQKDEADKLNFTIESINKEIQILNEIKIKQSAAVLASQMEPGDACPVCGSHEHISPAIMPKNTIDINRYEEVEFELKEKNDKLFKINGELNKISGKQEELSKIFRERCSEITAHTGLDKFDIENLENFLEKNINNIKELKISENKLSSEEKLIEKIESQINELERELSQCDKNIKDENSSLNDFFGNLKIIETKINTVEHEVPKKYLQEKNLEEISEKKNNKLKTRLKEIEDLKIKFNENIKRITELESNKNNLELQINDIEKEIIHSKTEFKNTLIKENFNSYDQYSRSKMDERTVNVEEKKIKEYDLDFERTSAEIKIIEKDVSNIKFIDLNNFEDKIKKLEDEHKEISTNKNHIENKRNRNEEIKKEIEKITKAIGVLDDKYYMLAKLSTTANGKNNKKLSFERYVLTAFLDDILKAANIRLKKMSSNRYSLKRFQEVTDKRSSAGLDLHVIDSHTGMDRHVNTLSGGESFKASLSMALGLSDVVQSYSGGVQLDTMFIDEGFGTLDPESLDQAMDCLVDIQKTGRLVGIISHVPDLKERIKTQLEVFASSNGSSTNNFSRRLKRS